MWLRSSSGSLANEPHRDLRFSDAVYAFPAGLMPSGCVGTAVATAASSAKASAAGEVLAFLLGRDSAHSMWCSRSAPGAIVHENEGTISAEAVDANRHRQNSVARANEESRRFYKLPASCEGETVREDFENVSLPLPALAPLGPSARRAIFAACTKSAHQPSSSIPIQTHTPNQQNTLYLDTLRFSYRGSGIYLFTNSTLTRRYPEDNHRLNPANSFSLDYSAAPVVFRSSTRNHG